MQIMAIERKKIANSRLKDLSHILETCTTCFNISEDLFQYLINNITLIVHLVQFQRRHKGDKKATDIVSKTDQATQSKDRDEVMLHMGFFKGQ